MKVKVIIRLVLVEEQRFVFGVSQMLDVSALKETGREENQLERKLNRRHGYCVASRCCY
jgi:hypothetical protein